MQKMRLVKPDNEFLKYDNNNLFLEIERKIK